MGLTGMPWKNRQNFGGWKFLVRRKLVIGSCSNERFYEGVILSIFCKQEVSSIFFFLLKKGKSTDVPLDKRVQNGTLKGFNTAYHKLENASFQSSLAPLDFRLTIQCFSNLYTSSLAKHETHSTSHNLYVKCSIFNARSSGLRHSLLMIPRYRFIKWRTF